MLVRVSEGKHESINWLGEKAKDVPSNMGPNTPQPLRGALSAHQATSNTAVFLDFHRSCPGWNHNWPATGERDGSIEPQRTLPPRTASHSWTGVAESGSRSVEPSPRASSY